MPRAPALFFGSTTDVQPSGRPGEHFDQLAPESNATSYPEHRAVVWVDGTLHGDFVGVPGPALAAIQGYVPPFLRSQAFNGSDELWWSYATMDAWPPEVVDDDIWDDIEVTYNLHADVDCSAIEIGCDTTPGCVSAPDDTCIDEPRIKTMVAPPSVYRHPVKLFEETDASEFDNPSDMTVVVDAATQATFGLGPTNAADSRLIRVDYGSPDPVGQLRFPVTEDMFDKTHLSLRAGNVLEHDNLCNAASEEAVRFDVSLARGGLESSVAVSTGRLPQQFLNQALNTCPATQAMQTVRFNLGQWCEDFGGDDIDEIVLTFEEPVEPARVIIDTIELTNVPEDEIENLPPCGVVGEGGMWACEIDDLAITETSCAGEPTGAPASCSSANLRTNAVDPPEVEFPGEDAFSGWAVHTRPGVVVDVFDPTAEELDRVRARCIEACELEYANQPDISAECDDADAFLTPTLLSEDSHASAFQIPRSMIHGEWAITEEALDCDLRVDCCEAFDEGLCPARPWRSTEARMPLGRGQEWSYTTTGVIVIDSEAMAEPVMGDITGTLGGSLCDAGTATEACPVYLGSATVELADPLTVSLACGGQTVVHTLDELSLSLAQPAFGLKSHDEPDWSAFPPGSLVFDAHTVVDAIEIDTFLPNEDGVTMKFNAGWAQVPLFSHFEVTIDVPCGGQMVPVSAWFGLVDDDVLGSPPSGVAITVPCTLTCPQTRALTGTASDADNDIASVRWKVDDVLLAPGTTSMAFTQDHDLTAIVRDARGATRTVHKHVDCL